MKNNPAERQSRALTRLLRHDRTAPMDSGGWLSVDVAITILKDRCRVGVWNVDKIKQIVREDPKARFELQEGANGQLNIRASQGHSISIDDGAVFHRITEEDACGLQVAHGTTVKAWAQIQRDGWLRPCQRRHIHFATIVAADSHPLSGNVSGLRDGWQVLLWLDIAKALREGFVLWRSSNHVVLCAEPLPLSLISRIEHR